MFVFFVFSCVLQKTMKTFKKIINLYTYAGFIQIIFFVYCFFFSSPLDDFLYNPHTHVCLSIKNIFAAFNGGFTFLGGVAKGGAKSSYT